ncbi:MAG: hypothetical protein CM1200mP30_16400 [Pseudomonadota bacterium]|nr:MAG: hypothetical protein CM1200mP30_16400 [Pseudomonadota bacterium]
MDYEVIFSNIPLYFEGLWVTIQLVIVALVLGFILALPIALLATSRSTWFRLFPKAISISSGALRSWYKCS